MCAKSITIIGAIDTGAFSASDCLLNARMFFWLRPASPHESPTCHHSGMPVGLNAFPFRYPLSTGCGTGTVLYSADVADAGTPTSRPAAFSFSRNVLLVPLVLVCSV